VGVPRSIRPRGGLEAREAADVAAVFLGLLACELPPAIGAGEFLLDGSRECSVTFKQAVERLAEPLAGDPFLGRGEHRDARRSGRLVGDRREVWSVAV